MGKYISKKQNKAKKGMALAITLSLALGVGGLLYTSGNVYAAAPKDTVLKTRMNGYWQGRGDHGYNETLLNYRRAEQDYWTHWLTKYYDNGHTVYQGDTATGYMDTNRLMAVYKDTSDIGAWIKFLTDGFSEMQIRSFHDDGEPYVNGAYRAFFSFTEVQGYGNGKEFSLYKDRYGNRSYVISPLTYLNEGSHTRISDGSILTLMMPDDVQQIADKLGVDPVLVALGKGMVKKFGGILERVVNNPPWMKNANVTVTNNGNLVLMVLGQRPTDKNYLKLDSGNLINFANLNGLHINTGNDAFEDTYRTGNIIFNTGAKLYLDNDGRGKLNLYHTNIEDINLFESGINLGLTYVGSTLHPNAVINFEDNSMEQGVLAIAKGSTFTSKSPDKLQLTAGIINDGTLKLTGPSTNAYDFPTNTNIIAYTGSGSKAALYLGGIFGNTASIKQKEIHVENGAKITNSKDGIFTPIMTTISLDNAGSLIFKDGYILAVDPNNENTKTQGGTTNLGSITLDNGSSLTVGTHNTKVNGNINILGKKDNTLSIDPTSKITATLNIGTESGDTGNLLLTNINLDTDASVVLNTNSFLKLGSNAKATFDGNNDLLNGTIKLVGGEASFGRPLMGLDFAFKGTNGTVNIGGTQFANGGELALNNDDSYITNAKLNLAANGELTLNSPKAKVDIDGDDTWQGTINLKQGNLNVDYANEVGNNGILQATGGNLTVAAGHGVTGASTLNIANGSVIEAGTKITTGAGGAVFSGGGLKLAGGEVTINGKGSSGKLEADEVAGYTKLDSGTLTIKDKADYVTKGETRYRQNGGKLIIDNAQVTLNAVPTISEFNNTIQGGTVQLRNNGVLAVQNAVDNTAELTADDSQNTLAVDGSSKLTLNGNSNITTDTKVNVTAGSTIAVTDRGSIALSKNDKFEGTVVSTGDKSQVVITETIDGTRGSGSKIKIEKGTLKVSADTTLTANDELVGGRIVIDNAKTLTNNYTIKTEVQNAGNITGIGNLEVVNSGANKAHGTIEQNAITVKKGGSLYNDNQNIDSVSANTITVERGGSLSTNLSALSTRDNKVINNGTLTVTNSGGTADYNITGDGAIAVITTGATFDGNINQKTLNVSSHSGATLNGTTALTEELNNHGELTNNGDMTVVGNVNNVSGALQGTGDLTINNFGSTASLNSGTIAQKNIKLDTTSNNTGNNVFYNLAGHKITTTENFTIDSQAKLYSNGDDLAINGTMKNGGTFVLEGGTVSFSVEKNQGTLGTINVTGNSTIANSFNIDNDITIKTGKSLTVENADSLKHAISNNAGELILQGGINAVNVDGSGKTVATGTVTNKGTINQGLSVTKTGEFTSTVENLKKEIQNDGILNLSGTNITAANTITGTGTLNIDDSAYDHTVNNSANITQDTIKIANANTFINNVGANITANKAFDFSGTLTNNGTVTANNATVTEGSIINGTGTFNAKGNSVNNSTITQGMVKVLANSTLENTGVINGAFHNVGTITGNGVINVTNNSTVEASISNQINNVSGKTIDVKKSAALDKIVNANNSTVNFVSGSTVKVNEISVPATGSGSGTLGNIKVDSNTRVEANGAITGQNITVANGTLALGASANLGGASSIALQETGKLDLSTLSQDNNAIHLHNLDVQTSNKQSGLLIDVNLADQTSDKIYISGKAESTTGDKLHLQAINITQDITDIGVDKRINLVATEGTGTIASSFKIADNYAATNTGSYHFKQDGAGSGDLLGSKINNGITLAQAIADSKYNSYSFTNQDGYVGTLGYLNGSSDRNFTIFGNGNTLNGNGKDGLTIWGDRVVTIKDATIENYKKITGAPSYGFAIAISENGTAILDGVTMKDNVYAGGKTDIFNDANVYFTGKDSYLYSGIINADNQPELGKTYINGTTLTMGDGVGIRQSTLKIDANGKLIIDADKIEITKTTDPKVDNDGVLELKGTNANLSSNIGGTGITNIVGTVTNTSNKTIDNKLNIAEDASLNSAIENLKKTINNDGTLILSGSTIETANTITGSGTLLTTTNMTNKADITQGTVKVSIATTLTNQGNIVGTESLKNNGALVNTGTVTGVINNLGAIIGTGSLHAQGNSTNGTSSVINQKDFIISNGILTNNNANTDALTATNGITIKETGKLVTNAHAVNSDLSNAGIYEVTGGDIRNNVTGEGATVINTDSKVTNSATLNQEVVAIQKGELETNNIITAQVEVSAGATLTSNTDKIDGITINDGTYNATGTAFEKIITGTGTLNVNNDMVNKTILNQGNTIITAGHTLDNQGLIYGHGTVAVGSTLNSSANDVLATIENNGTYNVQGGYIQKDVTGTGVMNIKGNAAAQGGKITQDSINLASNVTFMANADDINAVVNNEATGILETENGGIYQVTGGTITKNVKGGTNGILLVTGNVGNVAEVTQDYVGVTGSLNNAGTVVAHDLSNAGTFTNSGTLTAERVSNDAGANLSNHGSFTVTTGLDNAGAITGTGTLNLTGYGLNEAGASLEQNNINLVKGTFNNEGVVKGNLVTVDKESVLFSHGTNMQSAVANNGVYSVTNGTINYDVYDTDSSDTQGIILINGSVTNKANITQDNMDVDDGSSLLNQGTISLRKVLDNSGTLHNTGTINAPVYNEGTLGNDGTVNGTLANHNIIVGSGTMNLVGGNVNKDGATLTQGTINLSNGYFTNENNRENALTFNTMTVAANAELDSHGDAVNGKVKVDGLYNVQGGNIHGDISGDGMVQITANTTNSANVSVNLVDVDHDVTFTNNQGAKLTGNAIVVEGANPEEVSSQVATFNAYAADVDALVYNDGIYNLNAGSFSKNILGEGTLNIIGAVTSADDNLVEQGLMNVAAGASLNNQGFVFIDNFTKNEGLINNAGGLATYLNNSGNITGTGILELKGNDKPQVTEAQLIAAAEAGDVTDLVAILQGDTGSKVINVNTGNIIQGTIILDDYGILDNTNGMITADKMFVGNGATVTSNASNLTATLANDGHYYVLGGTINKNITGSGNVYLQNDTTNNAIVDQTYVDVASGKTLINNGVVQSSESVDDAEFFAMALKSYGFFGSNKAQELLDKVYGSGATIATFDNKGTVINNGLLSGVVNNTGVITGPGALELYGPSINSMTATINQSTVDVKALATFTNQNEDYKAITTNLLTIDPAGDMTSNPYGIGAPVRNEGTYNITGSLTGPNVITDDIYTGNLDSGTIQMNTEDKNAVVINDAKIDQALIIVGTGHLYNNEGHVVDTIDLSLNENGTMTTNASELKIGNAVDNEGTLNIRGAENGGVISYDIIGETASLDASNEVLMDANGKIVTKLTGTLNIMDSTLVEGEDTVYIAQGQVNVYKGATLTNKGEITATTFTNKGHVVNDNLVTGEVKNYGDIAGIGLLITKEQSETYGNIGNDTVIADGSLAAYDQAQLTGNILNNGNTLILSGSGQGVKVTGNISATDTQGQIEAGALAGGTALDRATITGNVQGQNINMHSGTLNVEGAPIFNNVNVNFAGNSTLATMDTTKSDLVLHSLTTASGITGKMSFDLGDTVNVASTGSGAGTLKLGNVLVDVTKPINNKTLFFSQNAQALTGTAVTFSNGNKYTISQDLSDKHYLTINQEVAGTGLNPAIDELTTRDEVTFVASGTVNQTEDVHPITDAGKHLLIVGNAQDDEADNIVGSQVGGLTIGTGSGVAIQNINNVSGFASSEGGFANNHGTLNISSGNNPTNITGNSATGNGGAITNVDNGLLGGGVANLQGANTNFSGNSAGGSGGAVANLGNGGSAQADLSFSDFTNNTAGSNGGALVNQGTGAGNAQVTLEHNEFTSNSAVGHGGAIANIGDTTGTGSTEISMEDVNFTGNSATGNGGAIFNAQGATINNGTTTPSLVGQVDILGGNFSGNSAGGSGGAIYNGNTTAVTLTDVNLTNNSAANQGGAIYTNGNEVTINAATTDVNISGNTAHGQSNALHLANTNNGTNIVGLEARDGNNLTLNDGITAANSGANNLVLNLNTGTGNKGAITLGENFSARDENGNFLNTDYQLTQGQLNIGSEANFSGNGQNNLTMASMSGLNTNNNKLGNLELGSLITTGNKPYFTWGMDLGDNASDQIKPSDDSHVAPGTILNINDVNVGLVSDTLRNSYSPLNSINNLTYDLDPELNGKLYEGKIFDRVLSLQGQTLAFEFSRFNPSVMASSLVAQATLSTQMNSYDQAFGNIDGIMDIRRTTGKHNDVWAKVYRTSEDMRLGNLTPGNQGGGTFFGVDSKVHDIGKGWNSVYTAYAGYNHMKQDAENVHGTEDSGTLGVSALFTHKNFFTAVTANVGTGKAEVNSKYGTESFRTTSYGISNKTGYNFSTDRDDWKLQVSNTISYARVNVADYTNAAGITMGANGLNSVQIAPEIKLTMDNLAGWRSFVGAKRVWNFGGETHFTASGVALDQYKPGAYNEYSLGLGKQFTKKFSADGKFAYRQGSRNGYGLQLNMNWFF